MTRDQIISQLFTGKNFNDCIRKMEPAHLQDDLKMEVIMIVCSWSDEKIIGLHQRGELDYFVVRVILNQIQSNTSPFYRKYRGAIISYMDEVCDMPKKSAVAIALHTATDPDEIAEREQREKAEDIALSEIDKLYWYKRDLIWLYKEHGNYRALGKMTNIPFMSIYKAIQQGFKELKDKALCSITA